MLYAYVLNMLPSSVNFFNDQRVCHYGPLIKGLCYVCNEPKVSDRVGIVGHVYSHEESLHKNNGFLENDFLS